MGAVTVGYKHHWSRQSGRQWLGVGWAPWRGGGEYPPPFQCIPGGGIRAPGVHLVAAVGPRECSCCFQVRVTRPSLGGSQLVPVSSARPVDDIVEVDDVDLKQLLTQLANQLEAGVADIPNPDAAERHMNSVELLRQGIGRMEVKKETQPTMDTAGAFFQMSRRGTVVGGSRRATINPMSLIRGNSVGGEVLFTNATPRDAENSGSPSTQGK